MNTVSQQSNKGLMTDNLFAGRMTDVPRSFIREILKVAGGTDVISFAGGLPNPKLFPVNELQEASDKVLASMGAKALQYSNSEGYLPLREYIAERYRLNNGFEVSPKNILITTGSQQGLDLLAKVFINSGDEVIIEEPGYLGAIQAMSIFQPKFIPVPLNEMGMDMDALSEALQKSNPKLMYLVPDFQNPSGISYTSDIRKQIAQKISNMNTLIIEDSPYADIRFTGTRKESFYNLLPEQTILLGTFSKIAVPGFRLGWVVAPDTIMDKLIIAKQAADLHTSSFTQCVLSQYLKTNNIDENIREISDVYGRQCKTMVDAIKEYFPKETGFTQPEGGMFLWVTLPNNLSANDLFKKVIAKKVAFVPGNPFYVRPMDIVNTMRLNYSCSSPDIIERGISIMGKEIHEMLE